MRLERDFQTKFGHWLKENCTQTAAFELKFEKGGTFNVKQWAEKQGYQVRSLLAVKNDCLYYKISDMSAGQKPFDCVFFYKSSAYLSIFWAKRNDFTIISIEKLLPYLNKSIKYDEAVSIARKRGNFLLSD